MRRRSANCEIRKISWDCSRFNGVSVPGQASVTMANVDDFMRRVHAMAVAETEPKDEAVLARVREALAV